MFAPNKSFLNSVHFGLYLMIVLVEYVHCHRCYQCGPRQLGFNKNCDNFNSNPESFIEYCNPTSFGCSIQYQGSMVTRQCEEHKLNDCKVANGVKYCFCSSELCNGNNPILHPNDDEDFDDGSGIEEIADNTIESVQSAVGSNVIMHLLPFLAITVVLY